MSWLYLTEAGAKLGLREGRYVISRENETMAEIPSEMVEGVTLIDAIQVSSKVIVDCLKRNIPVTWLSTEGKFFGRLESISDRDVIQVKKQFDMLQDGTFCLNLGRMVIFRKIYNQRAVLRSYNRRAGLEDVKEAYDRIRILADQLHKAKTIEEVMEYEGAISRIYFKALSSFLPSEFQFEKDREDHLRISSIPC